MATSKTNEQVFEALIERALVGTTIEERKEAGQTDVDAQCPSESQYYWGYLATLTRRLPWITVVYGHSSKQHKRRNWISTSAKT